MAADFHPSEADDQVFPELFPKKRGFGDPNPLVGYLIAFGKKPKPEFLERLRTVSVQDGVLVKGAILTEGPGCANLAVLIDEFDDEGFPLVRWVEQLTMVLQPARYKRCFDPTLKEGEFVDWIHDPKAP